MEFYRKRSSKTRIILIAIVVGSLFLLVAQIIHIPSGFNQVSRDNDNSEQTTSDIKIGRKSFGTSEKGKVIEGYEIGTGDNVMLLFGAIHGNEMGTAELLRQLVLEIALEPTLVSRNSKLIIIPVANPDGYYDRTDNLDANEVNLNLNFATSDWQTYGPEGTYAGPRPFSEIESQVIRQVVEQYKPNVMISYHSHGSLISPETATSSITLAKWYAKKTGYTYYDAWDYPGTATKWFEETTGNPAITVELSKDLQSDWETNKGPLLELISSDHALQT